MVSGAVGISHTHSLGVTGLGDQMDLLDRTSGAFGGSWKISAEWVWNKHSWDPSPPLSCPALD